LVTCLEAYLIMVTCLGVHFFGGVWITQKLSAIFEALMVSDVNELVIRNINDVDKLQLFLVTLMDQLNILVL
jgi:hypothetical protein